MQGAVTTIWRGSVVSCHPAFAKMEPKMRGAIAALALVLAMPAVAQTPYGVAPGWTPPSARGNGICEMIARRAYQAAERRDGGLDQSPLQAEITDARRMNNQALLRVFQAMLRDIPGDRSLSPREAYAKSIYGPCGWPGASPVAGASAPR
jgi:hypothetical protein